MSAGIISVPTKSSSNWNALGNPVIFKLGRADYQVAQINNDGGFAQLQINGTNVAAYFTIGNTVNVIDSGYSAYTSAAVTASTFSVPNTLVTLDVSYATLSGYTSIKVNNISKRTDYRLEYNFKNIVGDEELLGVELSVSPDSEGIMILNASLLKNIISAEWSLPAGVNEVDSTGSIGFYLSCQEYYDGALQGSVTNFTANPIYGLLGANQIGSPDGSNMLAYFIGSSTKKFLTRFQLNSALRGLKMWRDWPFTLSFIWPTSQTNDISIDITEYDASGTIVAETNPSLTAHLSSVNRIKFPAVTTNTTSFDAFLYEQPETAVVIPNQSFENPWTNVADGSNVDWNFGVAGEARITLGATDESDFCRSDAFSGAVVIPANIPAHIVIAIVIPAGKTVVVRAFAWDGSQRHQLFQTASITDSTTSIDVIPVSAPFDWDKLELQVESVSGASDTIRITAITTFDYFPVTVISETLHVEVDDACEYDEDNLPIPGQNPIMLQWKNSLGGDAQWLFPFYNETSYNLKGRKAKRIVLFDQDLSAVQWEALQELISTNEVYSPPIIDLENTNTINYTSKQVGKQVYMIDQDGNKTGVIVIPNSDRINARDPSHRIAIEIELPETQDV